MNSEVSYRDRPEHIGTVLDRALRKCRRSKAADMIRICELWDSIVGSAVSENARPAASNGGVVLVHVTSSAWIHHLQFFKKNIIERINAALGGPVVSDIKFKIGPV